MRSTALRLLGLPLPGLLLRSGLLQPGLQRSGLQRSGLQRSGLQRSGLQRSGLQRTGLQRTGLQRTGPLLTGLLLTGLLLTGCARDFYETYRDSHPGWYVDFPAPDADLPQTLASLYAPSGANQRVISALRIFRTDIEPWREIDESELLDGRFQPADAHDYAVVVESWCYHPSDVSMHSDEVVSWYLLPGNRLRFSEHHDYEETCSVSRRYSPPTTEYAPVEVQLRRQVLPGLGSARPWRRP